MIALKTPSGPGPAVDRDPLAAAHLVLVAAQRRVERDAGALEVGDRVRHARWTIGLAVFSPLGVWTGSAIRERVVNTVSKPGVVPPCSPVGTS